MIPQTTTTNQPGYAGLLTPYRLAHKLANGDVSFRCETTASLSGLDTDDIGSFTRRLATIIYQIQHHKGSKNNAAGLNCLETNATIAPMFSIESSLLNTLLTPSTGKAPTLALPTDYRHSYDMRSLAYVCGVATAAGLTRTQFNPQARAAMNAPNEGFLSFELGDVLIENGLCTTADQQETFSAMAGEAGAAHVRLCNGRVAAGGQLLAGAALAEYAHRVAMLIGAFDTTSKFGCHSLFAFARGLSSHLTLRGHCDEGGFTRSCFRYAEYPPATGLIRSTPTNFLNINLDCTLPADIVAANSMYLFFTAVAAVMNSRSCTLANGITAVPLIVTNSAAANTSDQIPRLSAQMTEIMSGAERKYADHLALPTSNLLESANIRREVFAANDPHLSGLTITPGAWVEVGGLQTKNLSPAFDPGFAVGKRTTLPLFDAKQHVSNTTNGPGHMIDWYTADTSMRHHGANYYFSAAFSSARAVYPNGLSNFRQVRVVNVQSKWLANAAHQPALNLARWNTAHNPFPNESEGHCVASVSVIRYIQTAQNMVEMPIACTLPKLSVHVQLSTLTCDDAPIQHTKIVTVRNHCEQYSAQYARAMRIEAPDHGDIPVAPREFFGWCCMRSNATFPGPGGPRPGAWGAAVNNNDPDADEPDDNLPDDDADSLAPTDTAPPGSINGEAGEQNHRDGNNNNNNDDDGDQQLDADDAAYTQAIADIGREAAEQRRALNPNEIAAIQDAARRHDEIVRQREARIADDVESNKLFDNNTLDTQIPDGKKVAPAEPLADFAKVAANAANAANAVERDARIARERELARAANAAAQAERERAAIARNQQHAINGFVANAHNTFRGFADTQPARAAMDATINFRFPELDDATRAQVINQCFAHINNMNAARGQNNRHGLQQRPNGGRH